MNEQREKAAAEPPLDCRVGHDTPRVEALIDRVMAMHPRHTAYGQARYYEEVHQHLAPLARELERENARLRKVVEAARCIRHWHDSDNDGMVVSGEHVRALWLALFDLDAVPNAEITGRTLAKNEADGA